jgi:TonB family protein
LDAANIARGFLFLLGLGAAAQPPVFRPGPDVTAPFVVAKVKPEYSEEARIAKLEGSVLLSVVVGADGQPRDIHVARALGLGLDEEAVENVRAWQFRPGTRAGNPVAVQVNLEVFFRPERTLWDWHVVRAVFRPPAELGTRPTLTHAKFPRTVDVEENASVTIAFDISAKGVPVNVRAVKSSNAKWESELLTAVSGGWRFRPGMVNGKPVTVPAWFEFVRGSHSPIPPVPIPPAPSSLKR